MTRLPLRSLLVAVIVWAGFVYATGEAIDQSFALREGAPQATSTPAPHRAVVVSPAGSFRSELAAPSLSANVTGKARSLAAIRAVFGGNVRARKVAVCESKLDARAVSRTGDYGLFQLNRRTWDPALNPRARPYWPPGKDWRHVFDPVVNARVAYAISRRGTDFWTHWRWSASCWA